ncbi:peptidylprolyl isomerase [Winogradskyella maritima]|uniref:Peptidyl-prolyl cis-trans isomerase n=1 Tax=Winogradskyella maritima TaxID=1517766 RepID=A0ABV8AIF2_9FLAO|nr:peptidylprolyl isomerase [Winogradskyella maritima]
MRLYVLLIFLLLLNCEDKQSKSNQNTKVQDSVAVKSEKATATNKAKKREYPKLTDKNAMDFFLEYEKENPETKVRLTTDYGTIDLELYTETKFHRANFIYLTKQGYFDGTQFYRVVKNFVIQGGSSDDFKITKKRKRIGRYLLPTDARHGFTHSRGTLSTPNATIDNPYKLASPYQFFIVQQPGGASFLDGDYTIFGRVIDGMDTVDKINAVPTDEGEWPLKNVYIWKAKIID